MAATGKALEPGHDGGVQESANGDSSRAVGEETKASSGQDAPKGLYRRLVYQSKSNSKSKTSMAR